jgi:hypothetical protein
MVIQIRLKGRSGEGTRRVMRKLENLPKNLEKELSKGSGEWMKKVQKSAKLRAPRDTTKLKDSIKLKKIKNGWLIDVQSPYGKYQEEGFKPHWIHTDMMKGSKKPQQEGFVWVSGFKPFVKPALEHNLSKLSQTLSKATKLGLKQNV